MKQIPLDLGLASGPTLDNFFVGPNADTVQHLQLWLGNNSGSNHSSSSGGKQSELRSPVPTYLWGPAGSGKSHLLMAAHTALREQGAQPGWIDASRHDHPDYNDNWAAVLLDDVHLYTASQQQLAFSWFVQAQTLQRPVLAAGLLAPVDLQLRDDLRSRLGWGHVFGLQLLTETERRAVLRQAADARGVFLGEEVMDFVLHRFSRDLGSLLEMLNLLDDYSLQTKRAITIPLIKSMLENQ